MKRVDITKVCVICGKPFEPYRPNGKTCGKECSIKYSRMMDRKRREEGKVKTYEERTEFQKIEARKRRQREREAADMMKARDGLTYAERQMRDTLRMVGKVNV